MIEIEVFEHSDSTMTLQEIGVEYQLDSCNIAKMVFININAISPYRENGCNYTMIHCNGNEFISPLPYSEVKDEIIKNTNSYGCTI